MLEQLPVVIIGAGPVGLAAAAHLVERDVPFVVLEAGPEVGAAVRAWGHVRMFSPWRYNVDAAARRLLNSQGWLPPADDVLPTGNDLVDRYLVPLASHPAIAARLRLKARVTAIGRKDFDKVRTKGRDEQPFEIRLEDGEILDARAVIDATGTWWQPNPMGSGGLPVRGERELADHISYGIPNVLGVDRARFGGKRVMVVGSGHSAMNVMLDLVTLAKQMPQTDVLWAMRRDDISTVFGGGSADALPARGELGLRARGAIDSRELRVLSPYRISGIGAANAALEVRGRLGGKAHAVTVDEIVVATGFRPDLDMLREIRSGLDPWLECTQALGPLIDPNVHSCGTVRPHGARELAHPEKDFFVIGMKSYGRAPTFLLATGYEQARSVVAMLTGDVDAAARVELALPETGVCSTAVVTSGAAACGTAAVGAESATATGCASPVVAQTTACCGGPAPQDVDACCVKDAEAKAIGESGCGCGTDCSAPAEGRPIGAIMPKRVS
jgi:thioredoxin reductase